KRRVPELSSPNEWLRSSAERQLVNAVIQGSAADLNKLSMVRTYQMIQDAGLADQAAIILSVHDEIVVECREDIADTVVDIVNEAMIGKDMQALIDVPLTADVKIVRRWSEAKG